MKTWTKALITAAALASGCTGMVSDPGTGTATGGGTGTGGPPGSSGSTGNTGSGGASGPLGTGGTTSAPTACSPGVPGTSRMPLLTNSQYDNTVQELFGLNLTTDALASTMLAPDGIGSVDQRTWTGFQGAADMLVGKVMADATIKARVLSCTPSGDGSACAAQFIKTFGAKAFRRPLTADETSRFMALFTKGKQITATGAFDEVAAVMLKTFLVSPNFLTRAELSETAEAGTFKLNDYEVASRLSYTLWGSMPDADLFAAAAAGKLTSTAGILEQAQRMLQDKKARAKVASFHDQYAHITSPSRFTSYERDKTIFPGFNPAMVPALQAETQRFFDYITFDQKGGLRDLLLSPVAFVNATTAPLYGLDASKYNANLTQVNLDAATRPGVLTRAGFLAAYSQFDRSAPILRGAFVQKEVLCAQIGAPPADALSNAAPAVGDTNRERDDAKTSPAACAGCHHVFINPTGFAFEGFNGIGQAQTMEGSKAINTTAQVRIGNATVDVKGAADLIGKIADSPEAKSCYAKKWVQFAYDRTLTSQDLCTVDTLVAKLAKNDYRVVDLISDLTQTQSFRYRALETE
ncbi:MAG TPA: DUF1592 domain-containing protein [Polyangia bacterium]|nr:DUF1592 domain-containing protein [Polyangia bacterium]